MAPTLRRRAVVAVRSRAAAVLVLAVAVATVLTLTGSRLAASQGVVLTAPTTDADVPVREPFDDFWNRAPEVEVALSAQETTPPMGGNRLTLRARAVHDSERIYILVEWPDRTIDRSVAGTRAFTDAAAVQFPVAAGQQVPSFCMGDPSATVNIWQWRAATQLDVEQGFQGVRARYANAVVDGYPFDGDELYAPGVALGNPLSDPHRASAVDNLVAGGFGTLTPDPAEVVTGWGQWRDGRWRVVFSRALDVAREGNVRLGVGLADIAFAVWDGGSMERDGMKSVANFLTLQVSGSPLGEPGGVSWGLISVTVLLAWLGIAVVMSSDLRPGRR